MKNDPALRRIVSIPNTQPRCASLQHPEGLAHRHCRCRRHPAVRPSRALSLTPPKIELPTGPAVSTLSRASGMETGPSNIADLSTPLLGTNERIPDQSLKPEGTGDFSPDPFQTGLDWIPDQIFKNRRYRKYLPDQDKKNVTSRT